MLLETILLRQTKLTSQYFLGQAIQLIVETVLSCVVCGRLMFWTDWNRDEPRIEKANMDGTERWALVTEGLGLPNGLTIDYHSSQVCWADAGKSGKCVVLIILTL